MAPNRSASAPANGCAAPHSSACMASASANTSRPQPLAFDIGDRKKPKVERGPKPSRLIRQPHARMTMGVRQGARPETIMVELTAASGIGYCLRCARASRRTLTRALLCVAGFAGNHDIRWANRCADQRKSSPVQHERLSGTNDDVIRIVRLRDPQDAAQALHHEAFAVMDVEHLARLEMHRICT